MTIVPMLLKLGSPRRQIRQLTIDTAFESWFHQFRPKRMNMTTLRGFERLETLTLMPFRVLLKVPWYERLNRTYGDPLSEQYMVREIKKAVNELTKVTCPPAWTLDGLQDTQDKIIGPVDVLTLRRIVSSGQRRFRVVLVMSLYLFMMDDEGRPVVCDIKATMDWDAGRLMNKGASTWDWDPWYTFADEFKPRGWYWPLFGNDIERKRR